MQISWAGECSAWECDELGHMNMRYYLYKVAQARAMLFLRMGLGEIKAAPSALHIHYKGEARPGDPLYMESGVLDTDGGKCRLLHILRHGDDRLAATIIEELTLPTRLPALADGWMCALPHEAEPRSIDMSKPLTGMSRDDAVSAGFQHLGCGVFRGDEAGTDGRIRIEALMGRVTETVGHFLQAWPENYEHRESGPISGVLLEARLAFHARARAGQGYDFFSGVIGVGGKIRTLRHIMVDAVSGAPLLSMIGVAGIMDLNTRRLLDPSPETEAHLAEITLTP